MIFEQNAESPLSNDKWKMSSDRSQLSKWCLNREISLSESIVRGVCTKRVPNNSRHGYCVPLSDDPDFCTDNRYRCYRYMTTIYYDLLSESRSGHRHRKCEFFANVCTLCVLLPECELRIQNVQNDIETYETWYQNVERHSFVQNFCHLFVTKFHDFVLHFYKFNDFVVYFYTCGYSAFLQLQLPEGFQILECFSLISKTPVYFNACAGPVQFSLLWRKILEAPT